MPGTWVEMMRIPAYHAASRKVSSDSIENVHEAMDDLVNHAPYRNRFGGFVDCLANQKSPSYSTNSQPH